jgi:hypothetical protein
MGRMDSKNQCAQSGRDLLSEKLPADPVNQDCHKGMQKKIGQMKSHRLSPPKFKIHKIGEGNQRPVKGTSRTGPFTKI